jgi:hypothetical protein
VTSDRRDGARLARLAPAGAAFASLVALVIVPLALWHRVLGDVLGSFRWSLGYAVADLGPWLLLVAGVAFLVPVAISSGLHPESRLYPRARRAYFIWGVVLYLLGVVLVTELYDLWNYQH